MYKQRALNIFNSISNRKYELSKPIKDVYLDKYSIEAYGYGIYENSDNLRKEFNSRYCLIIDLPKYKKKEKILTTLLMNPSNTFPKTGQNEPSRFDNTVRNLIILADKMNYSKIIVLNSFPVILSNGKRAFKYYKINKDAKENKINIKFIKNVLKQKECRNLLVACGDKVDKDLYINYLDILRKSQSSLKIWTYAPTLTSKNRPRHLNAQSSQNRYYFKNFCDSPILYELILYSNTLKINLNSQLHP